MKTPLSVQVKHHVLTAPLHSTLEDADGNAIINEEGSLAHADAEHIAVCVNACEGVDIKLLAPGIFMLQRTHVGKQHDSLGACAELIAQLEADVLKAQQDTAAAQVVGDVMLADCRRQAAKRADALELKIMRLQLALRKIVEAPGGGPAKRIATMALGEADTEPRSEA